MGIKSFFSNLFGCEKTEETKPVAESHCSCCSSEKEPEQKREPVKKSAPAVADDGKSIERLSDFVGYVVKALVDYPDEVKIVSKKSENGAVISVLCRQSDRGKIIGRKGKTIIALRSIISGAAGRLQNRVTVEVPDEVDGVEA